MVKPTISFEFFPPKDNQGESKLWETMTHFESMEPDFISVTFGAGGSTRDRTIRIASQITERTSISTVAHLTCVGSTERELVEILTQYRDAGIKSVLALRGDPAGGPAASWEKTPGGFTHADELIELAAKFGDFTIGVAAFPDGHPASARNFDQDINVLLRKESLGASFATTQFFFDKAKWEMLVARLSARGSTMPIIPGILPITNIRQLLRMAELSGTALPPKILERFTAIEGDPVAVKALGIEIATDLAQGLLLAGAPGLHFYTMNSSTATREIFENLNLQR